MSPPRYEEGDLINVKISNDGVLGYEINAILVKHIYHGLYRVYNLDTLKYEEINLWSVDPSIKIEKIA